MFTIYYIELFFRGCRLGANIINYIAQISFAHHNNYYIKYDRLLLKYNDSIFVSSLFDYIDIYNKNILKDIYNIDEYLNSPDHDDEYKFIEVNIKTKDFIHMISNITILLNTDLVSYFKKNIFSIIKDIIESKAQLLNYNVNFDPNKTILIHLRLDDVRHIPDYDGQICSKYYCEKMNNKIPCYMSNLYDEKYNRQAPLSIEKLQEQINIISVKYPEFKIILVTNPGEKVNLSYDIIQSNDENLDLYLLCNCKVFILSRSTFALSALFFGEQEDNYIPLWGHAVVCGFSTKYDSCNYNYFY
jgi:hypothetical protein